MKIQFFFLLLPCVAGFFWLLSYLLFASKGDVFRRLRHFILIVTLFLLFTMLSLDDESRLLIHFTLFKQFFALLMIPSFLRYIKALQGTKPSGVFYRVMSFVPYLQLIVGIESVFSIGYENALRILIDSYTFQGPMFPYLPDNSQMVFYACYTYMFKTLLLADFLLFSINLMSCAISGNCSIKIVSSFFFNRQKAPVRPIQFFLALLLFLIIVSALILGKTSYIENIPLAAAGSFLIAFFTSLIAFVGTVGTTEYQSIPGIMKTVRFGKQDYADDSLVQEFDENIISKADDNLVDAIVKNADEPKIFSETDINREEALSKLRKQIDAKLEEVVVADKLFLKHDLSITFVSDILGVSKEELSDYLEYKYGLSFQNYINMLRINYSEQYLLSHDDVIQKEIAIACGFSGASSFNSAFSKKNGVTPKIWRDRQLEAMKNKES